jgi:hypothetical protein
MSKMSYGEIVTLLVPYEDPRTLALADAVCMMGRPDEAVFLAQIYNRLAQVPETGRWVRPHLSLALRQAVLAVRPHLTAGP